MNRYTKLRSLIAIALISTFMMTAVGCGGTNKSGGDQNTAISANKASQKTAEYESLFQKGKVIDIKIEIPQEDFKAMLDDPMAEEYKSAKVTVNGTSVENVGFRTKGNLTLRSVANTDSDRYSFRIKLNEYVKGQNLLGLDEFVVNNMYTDPSYMREYLSYEALREIGADVPETAFANIYINGELYGFYLCVEAIDDSFLERNFGNNDGSLYKQEKGSTLQYTEGGNYDSYDLKEGDDDTKADLKNFIKTLNEMPQGEKGNIEKVLDVDSALRYIAANTVLGNYDSYNGNMAQNYFLYGQEGKFTVLPWDYNMSFGGFSGGASATTIPIDEPVPGVNIKNLPLINNLLSVPEYKEKYHEYVKQLVSYLGNFEQRVNEVASIIRPYVEADPSKFYTMEQFETNIKYSETNTGGVTAKNPSINNIETKGNDTENTEGVKIDGNTGASLMANGEKGAAPQGGMEGFQQGEKPMMPEGFKEGERPAPPEGFQNGNMKGQDGRGNMKGGGGMTGGSIINYVKARLENIKKQLTGELPTTGNTTMTSNKMPGNK